MRLRRLLAPAVRWGVAAALSGSALACVFISRSVEVERIDPRTTGTATPLTVRSPVKAHLLDGSTVLFKDGVTIGNGMVAATVGTGESYDILLQRARPIVSVPLDSVVGMENYVSRTNTGTSVVLTTLGAVGTVLLATVAAVAIFGSCPTIYADSAGTPVLQAEVFANRISPLFEARDIDLLHVTPNAAGSVTLEVRNEALETHYINQFELIDVRHARDEIIIPDEHGRPLALRGLAAPSRALDRAGIELAGTLARRDGVVFSSAPATMAGVTEADPNDYIDFSVAAPPGADRVAVVLNLRNSLLNTVLLYDLMLGGPGARSLDWLAHDIARTGPVLQLGRWYRGNFGLRVLVRQGDHYEEVERHPTYGPVAWRDVATVVPTRGQDSVHIRLAFLADEWRIDELRVAAGVRTVRGKVLGVSRVDVGDSVVASTALRGIRDADERYLQTSPGQRFRMSFDVEPIGAGEARTFLLASQGYYTEWVRGSWIKAARDSVSFRPSRAALVTAIRRWDATRDSVERRFYDTRIPVR
jgi:hypothetical protein